MKRYIVLGVLCSIAIAIYAAPTPTLPLFGNLHFDWPMKNATITSEFGYRTDVKLGTDRGGADASLHFGLDLIPTGVTTAQAKRTQILAAEDGEAYIVYPPPGTPIPGSRKKFPGHASFGGCVMLRHVVGVYYGKTIYAYTLYGHMKEVWISEHDSRGNPTRVKKGQPIGLMGSTGQSTGPHLHFEILFDPVNFFVLTSAADQAKLDALQAKADADYLVWRKNKGY